MPTDYTSKDLWSGGFYELAVELGPASDVRLSEALDVLWRHPDLQGCFLDRTRNPADQPQVAPSLEASHLQGLVKLPNQDWMVCGTNIVHEEETGIDWLVFYIPLGSLASNIPEIGGYPFGSAGFGYQDWQKPIDDWLCCLGQYLYASIRYPLALVGFEVSGEFSAAQIAQQGIPPEGLIGFLFEQNDQLVWYPPT